MFKHVGRRGFSQQRSQPPHPFLSIPYTAGNEPLSTLLRSEQTYLPTVTHVGAGGEIALRRAILCDALHCFQQQFIGVARQPRHLAQEAEQWLFSDDTQWPFSFLNICAALELDPTYLRKRLLQWTRAA